MLLAINANNTNVKFTIFDGEDTIGEWRQHTTSARTADEHAVWLSQLFNLNGLDSAVIRPSRYAEPQGLNLYLAR